MYVRLHRPWIAFSSVAHQASQVKGGPLNRGCLLGNEGGVYMTRSGYSACHGSWPLGYGRIHDVGRQRRLSSVVLLRRCLLILRRDLQETFHSSPRLRRGRPVTGGSKRSTPQVGHSIPLDDARFMSRVNTAGSVASIVLPRPTTRGERTLCGEHAYLQLIKDRIKLRDRLVKCFTLNTRVGNQVTQHDRTLGDSRWLTTQEASFILAGCHVA